MFLRRGLARVYHSVSGLGPLGPCFICLRPSFLTGRGFAELFLHHCESRFLHRCELWFLHHCEYRFLHRCEYRFLGHFEMLGCWCLYRFLGHYEVFGCWWGGETGDVPD